MTEGQQMSNSLLLIAAHDFYLHIANRNMLASIVSRAKNVRLSILPGESEGKFRERKR
jgi:hypothetical protein